MNRITLLPFVALFSACTVDEQPVSADAAYLYGLDEDEVLSLADAYELDADRMLAQMSAPFDCGNFADLCLVVGPEAAEELIGFAVEDARAGYLSEEIQMDLAPLLEQSMLDWTDPRDMGLAVASGSQTDFYTCGSWDCKLVRQVSITDLTFYIEHKSKVTNYYESAPSTWTKVSASMYASIYSTRVKSGVTSTRFDDKSKSDKSFYVVNTMSTGGAHTAEACGRVVGATSTSCVSRSYTF